ncbi:hypothetical protein [Acidithiobacillus sulfurivorans]|uniref:Uncharacterized protein n=1 Tax=Acidithiobacillus sulfurivorans TaxID=1958756 RepID=A0ABS6A2E2_9PROT|nr:hypothetical protein [Acidithiobacillus sulfurivorans]MBU2761677.1 hypothetical protein [Acidithiobacillus sulfurivorans]
MRTKEDLEEMIGHQAKVRFCAHRSCYPASITGWPFHKTIYLHLEFLFEDRFSDATVKAVLLHQLALRDIPLFNAGPLIALLGFVMIAVTVGLHCADMLGRNWIWLGFGLIVLGVLVRVVLHDYLESKADGRLRDAVQCDR